ncbi:Highly reducing polyketide synthase FUM1, partial [Colletotrichum shisoi]
VVLLRAKVFLGIGPQSALAGPIRQILAAKKVNAEYISVLTRGRDSWHYEERLWHESRLSEEYRLRKLRHHELLGSRVSESTSSNPAWRNLLRPVDVPWVAEHEFEGSIIAPGVSYLCMAGEAVRQLTGEAGFTRKQVHFHAPLLMTCESQTEVITPLTQIGLTDSIDSDW